MASSPDADFVRAEGTEKYRATLLIQEPLVKKKWIPLPWRPYPCQITQHDSNIYFMCYKEEPSSQKKVKPVYFFEICRVTTDICPPGSVKKQYSDDELHICLQSPSPDGIYFVKTNTRRDRDELMRDMRKWLGHEPPPLRASLRKVQSAYVLSEESRDGTYYASSDVSKSSEISAPGSLRSDDGYGKYGPPIRQPTTTLPSPPAGYGLVQPESAQDGAYGATAPPSSPQYNSSIPRTLQMSGNFLKGSMEEYKRKFDREKFQSGGVLMEYEVASVEPTFAVVNDRVYVLDCKKSASATPQFHPGDLILKIRDSPATEPNVIINMIENGRSQERETITFKLKRAPYGVMVYIDLQTQNIKALGMELKDTVVDRFDDEGLVVRSGILPGPTCKSVTSAGEREGKWALTEINGVAVPFASATYEVWQTLVAAGKELALLFQPADFMKELHDDSRSRNVPQYEDV